MHSVVAMTAFCVLRSSALALVAASASLPSACLLCQGRDQPWFQMLRGRPFGQWCEACGLAAESWPSLAKDRIKENYHQDRKFREALACFAGCVCARGAGGEGEGRGPSVVHALRRVCGFELSVNPPLAGGVQLRAGRGGC